MHPSIIMCIILLASEWCIRAGSAADAVHLPSSSSPSPSPSTQLLTTQAAYFIEASPTLSRQSPVHTKLWDGVATIGAPMTMYMPWAPFPHYAVGALTPPTNNGTQPCETSWNMSVMDTMVEDYLNATQSFDSALSPYFQFSQTPCWMWLDGECNSTPTDPDQLAFPHKIYAAGRIPRDPSYKQVAEYFGRLAAYYRSGGFVDECGKRHASKLGKVPIRFWGVGNEGEHLPKDAVQGYTRMYDAILAGIKRHEVGGEQSMKFVAINQNFGSASKQELGSWLGFFLDKSNHASQDVQIDTVAMHAYFHGAGNTAAAARLPPSSRASAPLSMRGGPAPAPPLCRSKCMMVNETFGGHYAGTWRGASPRVGSLGTCEEACLKDATCRQMTWAPNNVRRPEGACVLYSTIETPWRQSSAQCQAATKCAAGSTVAEKCGAFAPSPPAPPPPPPPPPPGICDAWGLANISEYESVFVPLDEYLNGPLDSAITIVQSLAPSVGVAQGEFGVTLQGDIDSQCNQVVATVPAFQLAAAAVMGYGYGEFAKRGLDFVLQSQYTGHQAGSPWGHGSFPHNYYPSLSMYNWTTGALQPRAVVIQIINTLLHPGSDRVVLRDYADENDEDMPNSVYTLQFQSQDGRTAKLLLVNKAATSAMMPMSTALRGGSAWVVDETYTTHPPPRHVSNVGISLTLTPFATAIVVGRVNATPT